MDKYPLIDMTIDDHEDTGVDFISFVDTPAIEREWMAFNSQTKRSFAVQSEEKRIVSGAIMVANLPIYRRDSELGEYYVKFNADSIEKIALRFFKNGYTSKVNLDHSKEVDGVYMFESFLIDDRKKTPEGFKELPKGSWFGSFKVENDEVWEQVKNGTFRGFSIEGIFTDADQRELTESTIEKVRDAIQAKTKQLHKTDIKEYKNDKMSGLLNEIQKGIEALKVKLNAEETTEETTVELEDVKMVDGTILRIEPAIEVGATVQVIDENGEMIDAPDGDHELEDGRVLKTEGGIVVEVLGVEGEEVVEEEMSEETPEPTQPKLDVEALQNQLIDKLNTAITDKINNLKFAKEDEVSALKKENAELKESLIELTELVGKFAATPAEEPKKKVKNPFAKQDKQNFDYSKLLKK